MSLQQEGPLGARWCTQLAGPRASWMAPSRWVRYAYSCFTLRLRRPEGPQGCRGYREERGALQQELP